MRSEMKHFIIWVLLLFSHSSYSTESSDWMPDGISIDPNGNIKHSISFPSEDSAERFNFKSMVTSMDIGSGTQIINLSAPENIKEITPTADGEPPNDGSGFLVIKKLQGKLTIPISTELASVGPEYFGASLKIGVSISGGKGFLLKKHVKNYSEIKKLPFISFIPKDIKDWNQYSVGDSITYLSEGDLAFNVGVGNVLITVGFSYIASGVWETKVKKTGAFTVQAKYSKTKIHRLRVAAENALVSVSAEKYFNFDDSLFYEFNLADENGRKAYLRFINGDAIYAKEMALKLKAAKAFSMPLGNAFGIKRPILTLAVRPLMEYKAQGSGTVKKADASIPFLVSANYKKGTNFVLSDTKIFKTGQTGTSYLGIYRKESNTSGLLANDAHRISLFAGALQFIKDNNLNEDKTKIRYSANFKYEYHRQNFKDDKFYEELIEIANIIGHKKELLTTDFSVKGKYGYVQMMADLILSMDAINELMNLSKTQQYRVWFEIGKPLVVNWFADPNNNKSELCKILSKDHCQSDALSQLNLGLHSLHKSLIAMNQHLSAGNYKEFSLALADFGNSMLTNQFTFQTTLALIRQGDYHLTFNFRGERVPKKELVLHQSKKFRFNGLKVIR